MDPNRCRCCLTANSTNYYDIFEKYKNTRTFAENIYHIAEVNVELGDGLPEYACSDCYTELRNIFEFSLLIRQSDEKLRAELKQKHKRDDVKSSMVVEEHCFAAEEDEGMQVCILEEEEVLNDGDMVHQQSEVTIVEEYVKDGQVIEDLQMVEEVLELNEEIPQNSVAQSEVIGENGLLVELAQVAATQQNSQIDQNKDLTYHEQDDNYPEEEVDDDYLIEYNPAEESHYDFKPPKWKCGECKVILRGDVSYEGHMNMHRKVRPHKCPQCRCQFRCRAALKKHKEIRHPKVQQPQPAVENTRYEEISIVQTKCSECNEECQTEVDLLMHELIVHDKHTHLTSCPFCPDAVIDNLVTHLQSVHTAQHSLADETTVETSYEQLSPSPAPPTTWNCNTCSKKYRTLSAFNQHRKLCPKSNEPDAIVVDEYDKYANVLDSVVECEICKRKLQRKNLKRHMDVHERKVKTNEEETTKFLCAYCPREFKNSKTLHQHEKTHQGEYADTVYVCGDCDRQYTSQFLLDTHRKQAHKERDHVCSICGNAFKLKNQLMNHMKLHLEKNIQCPHCDKKYARRFDLDVHLRSHTGEMPYACHLCDKRFAIKVRLTYHLQKHYGVKHQCKECHAEFNSRQKLKAHSFKHTGMPYRCELCDDHGFANRVVFKRHLNRVHQATMSDEALNEMFQRNTGKTTKIKQVQGAYILEPECEDGGNEEEVIEDNAELINSSDIMMETEIIHA